MSGGIRQKPSRCKICGKYIMPLGKARHMAMHRDKAKDKQQTLGDSKPLKHSSVCKCYQCKSRREITGK